MGIIIDQKVVYLVLLPPFIPITSQITRVCISFFTEQKKGRRCKPLFLSSLVIHEVLTMFDFCRFLPLLLFSFFSRVSSLLFRLPFLLNPSSSFSLLCFFWCYTPCPRFPLGFHDDVSSIDSSHDVTAFQLPSLASPFPFMMMRGIPLPTQIWMMMIQKQMEELEAQDLDRGWEWKTCLPMDLLHPS